MLMNALLTCSHTLATSLWVSSALTRAGTAFAFKLASLPAAMQAMLMSVYDRALHRRLAIVPNSRLAHWLEDLPPLMMMEGLLFNLLYVGFALLTMTIFSGLFFSQVLFGKPFVFDHKTIFALVSWVLFAGLLIARWWVGLRGWAAIRWVLSAYVVLLLAYVGSRFVLEVVLQRA